MAEESKTKLIRTIQIALSLVILQSAVSFAQNMTLIPLPAEMRPAQGIFTLSENSAICFDPDDNQGRIAASQLSELLNTLTGYSPTVRSGDSKKEPSGRIVLNTGNVDKTLGTEGYTLEVTPTQIKINANSGRGLFYGSQTLMQLCVPDSSQRPLRQGTACQIPCVYIKDYPRFQWRGLMLDCSRTFQSVDYLKKTIDRMAYYKLNILHLHLTDDQGWRIEIKKYPELTIKGARFSEKYDEPKEHEGFYTQQQMRELIRYAAARNITIVPEIEMPGHSLAALSCYPELSCSGGPFEIFPFFKGPGITSDIYCAGSEQTFEFLTDVLAEIIELFPSEYIHVGGDEAPKSRWQKCGRCQARIKNESLENEHDLQSYFIRRIEKFVNSKGRKIIGWDEILEGGLAPNAAVMSWRGTAGGIKVAGAGHDVVMSPTSHCYFDYTYQSIDTQQAYSFEPVSSELTEHQAKHILGLQANFWSHIDREPERVDYQLFPRLLAIAERGWSARGTRDWEDFRNRLDAQLKALDKLGVRYRHEPAGSWQKAQMTETYTGLQLNVTGRVNEAGSYAVLFEYSHGAHRLAIEYVELLADGQVVSKDIHQGVTGAQNKDNSYKVTLDSYRPDITYLLRCSVRSEGGTDSAGHIYFNKINLFMGD